MWLSLSYTLSQTENFHILDIWSEPFETTRNICEAYAVQNTSSNSINYTALIPRVIRIFALLINTFFYLSIKWNLTFQANVFNTIIMKSWILFPRKPEKKHKQFIIWSHSQKTAKSPLEMGMIPFELCMYWLPSCLLSCCLSLGMNCHTDAW